MSPSSAGRAAALEALAALKIRVPGAKLKKNDGSRGGVATTTGGDDNADPFFPVEVRLPITSASLPAAAEAFDVPAAWLLASVSPRATEKREGAADGNGNNGNALSISVSSFECEGLPRDVLDRATAGLRAAVASSTPPPLPLEALPAAAGAAFFAAVQSLAEIEPYETVDASGASVRRFSVQVEAVTVVEEAVAKKAEAAAAAAPPKPPLRAPFLPQKEVKSSSAQAEMRFLERRFGAALSILDEGAEDEEGEEEQEEQEEEGEGGGTKGKKGGESSRRRRCCRFRVSGFTPSDPAWRSGPVSLLGTIDFQRYPAPGSFSLFAEAEAEAEAEGHGKGRGEGGGGGGGDNGSVAAARLTLALRRAANAAAPTPSASPSVAGGGGQGGEQQQILRSLVRLADSRGGELSAAPVFSLSDDDDDDDDDETESDKDEGEESSSSSSSGSDTETESESEDEQTAAAAAPAAPSPPSSNAAVSGGGGARFALSLASLSLDGVEALSPAALSLELSCLRCSTAVLPPSLSAAGCSSSSSSPLRECGACRAPLSVSLQPRIAHASSSVVAVVRCAGCVPMGVLLPLSSFGAQCERCSRVAALRGGTNALPGGGYGGSGSSALALRRPCPSCHASLAVVFEECSFERMPEAGRGRTGGIGGGGTGTRRRRREAAGNDGGGGGTKKASEGATPLPRSGACDHYPHSHRAMRFPCCHRVHACDVCHELSAAADADHPPEVATVATRMVCGFCSKEQGFEKKGEPAVCRRCGRHLAGSSRFGTHGGGTRHWEGGKGCRNPKRMDRRDSKKHSGSKLKTRSKKAFRVGAEAAKKKQQRGEKKKE